jgi:threonylcarbamoyladenosine tRNA methylthiotransferase MtaB
MLYSPSVLNYINKKSMTENVVNFGCRLNAYESEVIQNNLDKSGLKNVQVFNTCAVTKQAEKQAKQAIRKFVRENPNKKIIVTGCAAQINPEEYSKINGVHKVIGNQEKLDPQTFINERLIGNTEKILVNDIMSVTETASHMVSSLEGKARAFLQVQNGCNHRCTFCIIPYGRGNSRSVPVGEVVAQTKLVVEQGYNEVVLTGVDISEYGLDLPGKPRLGEMIRRLLKLVPNLLRVRLSSIDVAEIDEDIFWLIENEPRFMPHLHLSLQSGDDMILKRMKRRHTRGQVLDFYERVKKLRPDMVFGADIITGFPTETEKMFENSLKIMSEIGIIHPHIFPYSEREGTPAAKIPASKQVPVNIRRQRSKILRQEGDRLLAEFLKTRIGAEENIVVERGDIGRTEHFAEVKLSQNLPVGSLQKVKIKSSTDKQLIG